jgi:hypothetical protein
MKYQINENEKRMYNCRHFSYRNILYEIVYMNIYDKLININIEFIFITVNKMIF